MNPSFDIIVPTYNRYSELSLFFEKNAALENQNVAVWLVDDCSSEKDKSVLPRWQNIHFIELSSNQGQAHARNVAIEKSDSPFVISLDDDAWFENSQFALKEIERLFNKYPDCGCIMFNIAIPGSDYSAISTGTELALHVTCGCVYRREVLTAIEGFSSFLHSGAEETDLSLRIYQRGWSIRFSQEIKVFHNFRPSARTLNWYLNVRYNTTRNEMLIVVMYYPVILVLPFIILKYLSHIRFAITYKRDRIKAVLRTMSAIFGFLKMFNAAWHRRRVMTMKRFLSWRALS